MPRHGTRGAGRRRVGDRIGRESFPDGVNEVKISQQAMCSRAHPPRQFLKRPEIFRGESGVDKIVLEEAACGCESDEACFGFVVGSACGADCVLKFGCAVDVLVG